MRQTDFSLYLVTDRAMAGERSLETVVIEAVQGGVTAVQLREKDMATRDFIRCAVELKKRLTALDVPLIINDRVDVALAVGADGVHLGQRDMPYEQAREILGKEALIGLSVETIEQAEQANRLDVDYIGLSPVFTTPTKTDVETSLGLDGVRRICDITRHPTVAIGGINRDTITDVLGAGAEGIAVVSAIMASESPREAARELAEIIRKYRSGW